MQLKHQTSGLLLVCFLLFLATSVSCNRAERSEQQVGSKQKEGTVGSGKLSSGSGIANELNLDEFKDDTKPPADRQEGGQQDPADQDEPPSYLLPSQEEEPKPHTIEIPSTWKRLSKKHEIWVDKDAKEVIVAGEVCLNQGPLEMFICPQATKEHESVIAANALSSEVHGALLFLGADPGKACSWDPEYRPAYGPRIEITLKWRDEESKKVMSQSAREWIRDVNTKKPLGQDWVFGGSEFWEDPDTKEQVYYGDSGEMICLSNFSTATIDLNVESSNANAGLLFEAFTENIPPVGTKVYAIIQPGERIEPAQKTDASKDEEKTEASEENQKTEATKKGDK